MRKRFCYIIFLFCLACQPNDKIVSKVTESFVFKLSADQIIAGEGITLQILNKEKYNGKAKLLIESGLSIRYIDLTIDKNSVDIDVNGDQLIDAGVVNFMLLVGGEIKYQKELTVLASDIVNPIELFTGPSTIWVNDIQKSMLVALAKDQYGNAAQEGEQISFKSRYPNSAEAESIIEVKNQLAYKIVDSDFESGKIFMGISEDRSSGKEQRVDVVQLWPEEIKIQLVELLPYADSRQFYKLNTSVLRDVNGDIIPDGTMVEFISHFKKRKASYKSYTIDGVANVYIRNPSFPSLWNVYAQVGGNVVKSNTIKLDFKSNVKDLSYKITDREIIVGPITSYIGQYIPDGTRVYLFVNKERVREESEDGFVRFERPDDLSNVIIRVAGETYTVTDD